MLVRNQICISAGLCIYCIILCTACPLQTHTYENENENEQNIVKMGSYLRQTLDAEILEREMEKVPTSTPL